MHRSIVLRMQIITLVLMMGFTSFVCAEVHNRCLVLKLSGDAADNFHENGIRPTFLRSMGIDSVKLVPVFYKPKDSMREKAWRSFGLNRWFKPADYLVRHEQIERFLVSSSELEYWQLLEPLEIAALPNDSALPVQWNLAKTKCTEAWEIYHDESPILLATLDTGCEIFHPDLWPNIRLNTAEDLNRNGVWDVEDNNGFDDDGNGFIDDIAGWDFMSHPLYEGYTPAVGEEYDPPDHKVYPDISGHGTWVTGTAAAATNNSIGVASASWNVRSMPLRTCFTCLVSGQLRGFGYPDDFSAAIQYAADNGANIISISAGGLRDSVLEAAVAYARSQHVLVFASAGNDNWSLRQYPAAYDGVVAVAAIDSNDTKAWYSNYGNWITLAGPGVDVWTTQANNSYHPADYDFGQGTSIACPGVAAIAALIWSYDRCLSDLDVRRILIETCDSIDSSNPSYAGELGTGRPNAHRALQSLQHEQAIANLAIADNGEGRMLLTWTNVRVMDSIRIQRNGDAIATLSPLTDRFRDYTTMGSYWYTIFAFDSCRHSISESDSATLHSQPQVATEYRLCQNYPNPFNQYTRIRYELPEGGHVKIEILNMLGQNIATLVDGYRHAAIYDEVWFTDNLASGVSFLRLSVNNRTFTKKMLLLR